MKNIILTVLLTICFAVSFLPPPPNEEQLIADDYYDIASSFYTDVDSDAGWLTTVLADLDSSIKTQTDRFDILEESMTPEDKEIYSDLINEINVLLFCLSANIETLNDNMILADEALVNAIDSYALGNYDTSWSYSLEANAILGMAESANECAITNYNEINTLLATITSLLDSYE